MLFCFGLLSPVYAADFHVTDAQSLKMALSVASGNLESDTIYLAKGTYSGGFEYLAGKNENSNLTIKAETGLKAADVILDGGNIERVLLLVDVYDSAGFTVERLTIQNGYGWFSGGLEISTGGNILVSQCVIRKNDSNRGGGIFASTSAHLTVKDNVISENTARNGAGIYPLGGKVSITGNTIIENIAEYDGGGIRVAGNDMTVSNNIISKNMSYRGGGLYCFQAGEGILTLSSNTISQNVSGYGGGVNTNVNTSVFVNNVITDNEASLDGGAISAYTGSGAITLTNNTVSGNSADDDAGGIDITVATLFASVSVYNNIVWNNKVSGVSEDIRLQGQGLKYGFNNDFTSLIGSWTNSADNIDSDPLFVNAASDDFHLTGTSPCIDTGDNDAPALPFTDRDGNIRIYDGNEDDNAVVDMGAYEYIPQPSIRNDVVLNIKANGSDGPVTLQEGEALSVTISLDPGDREGETADWWVIGWTPFGWTSYVHSGTSRYWILSLAKTWAGSLFPLGETTVIDQYKMPDGEYFFLFGLDMNGDGNMNYSDTVHVTIQ